MVFFLTFRGLVRCALRLVVGPREPAGRESLGLGDRRVGLCRVSHVRPCRVVLSYLGLGDLGVLDLELRLELLHALLPVGQCLLQAVNLLLQRAPLGLLLLHNLGHRVVELLVVGLVRLELLVGLELRRLEFLLREQQVLLDILHLLLGGGEALLDDAELLLEPLPDVVELLAEVVRLRRIGRLVLDGIQSRLGLGAGKLLRRDHRTELAALLLELGLLSLDLGGGVLGSLQSGLELGRTSLALGLLGLRLGDGLLGGLEGSLECGVVGRDLGNLLGQGLASGLVLARQLLHDLGVGLVDLVKLGPRARGALLLQRLELLGVHGDELLDLGGCLVELDLEGRELLRVSAFAGLLDGGQLGLVRLKQLRLGLVELGLVRCNKLLLCLFKLGLVGGGELLLGRRKLGLVLGAQLLGDGGELLLVGGKQLLLVTRALGQSLVLCASNLRQQLLLLARGLCLESLDNLGVGGLERLNLLGQAGLAVALENIELLGVAVLQALELGELGVLVGRSTALGTLELLGVAGANGVESLLVFGFLGLESGDSGGELGPGRLEGLGVALGGVGVALGEVAVLGLEFAVLGGKLGVLRLEIAMLGGKLGVLRLEVGKLAGEFAVLRLQLAVLRRQLAVLRLELGVLGLEVLELALEEGVSLERLNLLLVVLGHLLELGVVLLDLGRVLRLGLLEGLVLGSDLLLDAVDLLLERERLLPGLGDVGLGGRELALQVGDVGLHLGQLGCLGVEVGLGLLGRLLGSLELALELHDLALDGGELRLVGLHLGVDLGLVRDLELVLRGREVVNLLLELGDGALVARLHLGQGLLLVGRGGQSLAQLVGVLGLERLNGRLVLLGQGALQLLELVGMILQGLVQGGLALLELLLVLGLEGLEGLLQLCELGLCGLLGGDSVLVLALLFLVVSIGGHKMFIGLIHLVRELGLLSFQLGNLVLVGLLNVEDSVPHLDGIPVHSIRVLRELVLRLLDLGLELVQLRLLVGQLGLLFGELGLELLDLLAERLGRARRVGADRGAGSRGGGGGGGGGRGGRETLLGLGDGAGGGRRARADGGGARGDRVGGARQGRRGPAGGRAGGGGGRFPRGGGGGAEGRGPLLPAGRADGAGAAAGAVEVRRAVLLDSSSEADTLGRERWVAVDETLAGLRTVLLEALELPPPGGGPPATREVVEEVVLAGLPVLVDEDVVGRRTVEVAAAPELGLGFFREEAAETVDFVLGERGAALGASSCWTTSKLPVSDMSAGARGSAGGRGSVVGWFCSRMSRSAGGSS
ncbi:hypothetical protein ColLi_13850 [Colletotrichum liriopes]|uniref:Uncharacterized protein n=1 Tax=Colletotrichum liriopes TaxID=708192 RepID=A0AA37H319_9PEZI|nr:hypothetical protein ColLi_13850 [Colletotrichum liriopes]